MTFQNFSKFKVALKPVYRMFFLTLPKFASFLSKVYNINMSGFMKTVWKNSTSAFQIEYQKVFHVL